MSGLYTVCAKRARQKEHVHTDVGRGFGHVTTRLGHQQPLAGGAEVVSAGQKAQMERQRMEVHPQTCRYQYTYRSAVSTAHAPFTQC